MKAKKAKLIVKKLKRDHVECDCVVIDHDPRVCHACGFIWPCPTIRMIRHPKKMYWDKKLGLYV